MSNDLKTILSELRKEHKLTLGEVADKTGKSVSFLSDLEHGRTAPSMETLAQLGLVYQVTFRIPTNADGEIGIESWTEVG